MPSGQVEAHLALSGRAAHDRVDLVTASSQRPYQGTSDEAACAGHDDPHERALVCEGAEQPGPDAAGPGSEHSREPESNVEPFVPVVRR